MRAAPTERIAGLAFFAFTMLQISFFVVDSDLSASGIILMSPMQVTAANLAKQLPQAFHYIDDTLVPGGWVRESLSPYIRCQFKSGGKGPCVKERQRLFDMEYVRNGTNLPLLVELLETQGLASQQFIVYGCSLIVLSALFSLYYSVKTAVLGFVLLGYGIYEGNHIPLPPMVFVAFLCIYAGFQLGEPRGGAQLKPVKQKAGGQQQNGQQQKQQAGSSKGTLQKTSKRTQNRKQRK